MNRVAAFVRLSRPHFLLGGALMFGLGSSFVAQIDWWSYALGQSLVTSAQLTAHYVNEYADFEADKKVVNRTAFSGGSGVLATGLLHRHVALRAACVTTLITVVCVISVFPLSVAAGLIGLCALGISWAYSMPPVRLLDTGWGEVATALTVTVFVPLMGALLQSSAPAQLWWIMAQLMLLQVAMLLTFELPDVETDAIAGKRVLAVRIGRERTLLVIAGLIVGAIVVSIASVALGSVDVRLALGALVALPTAVGLLVTLRSERYEVMTFCGVATFFLCGCGLLLAQ